MRAVEGRDGPKVEVGQFLEDREAGGLNTVPLARFVTLGQFLLGQQQQEALVAQIGARGLTRDLGVLLRKDRQIQPPQMAVQQGRRIH
jgi:hypothetical protein